MKEFLDRVTGSDDDEEVELTPEEPGQTETPATVSAGPGDDGGTDADGDGRLERQVASSQSGEVELSEAGRSDDDGSDGFLPGAGGGSSHDRDEDTGSQGSGARGHGRGGTDAAMESIDRVIEQNKKIIGLLEQLVDDTDEMTGRADQRTDDGTDDADEGTPSLW